MKIIDLLNKIANGEEVPEKVKYNGEIYEYIKIYKEGIRYTNFEREQNDEYRMLIFSVNRLNDEVEILEEPNEEEKKIPEKLKWIDYNTEFTHGELNKEFRNICNTVDEIIDYLKSKGE